MKWKKYNENELNPYTDGLPPEIDEKLTKRYENLRFPKNALLRF